MLSIAFELLLHFVEIASQFQEMSNKKFTVDPWIKYMENPWKYRLPRLMESITNGWSGTKADVANTNNINAVDAVKAVKAIKAVKNMEG